MDIGTALKYATYAGSLSPCAKSKRGVAIFSKYDEKLLATGCNHPPGGLACDGSDTCRASCGKVAVHAEQAALLQCLAAGHSVHGMQMVHTKVVLVEGRWVSVPGGPPSCPDCSKLILESGIEHMWLIEEREGEVTPVRYTAAEFHDQTLRNCGLHPYK